jgi:hypothetical protein
MKKFTGNDVFVNTIKTYPKVKIFVNNGEVYYNGTTKNGPELNDYLEPPPEDLPVVVNDGFEYINGWPNTIANINYPSTFSFASPVATGAEDFESGW